MTPLRYDGKVCEAFSLIYHTQLATRRRKLEQNKWLNFQVDGMKMRNDVTQ